MPGILNEASTTLTLASFRCAASQSVETSGSLAGDVMAHVSFSSFRDAPLGAGPESITTSRGYGFRARSLRSRPGMTNEVVPSRGVRSLTLRLLRLEFFHRAAGVAPGRKAAADMRHRPQAHVLRRLGCERRAHAART